MSGNKKPQTFKKCEICGTTFGPVQSLLQRFCSRKCGYLGRKDGGKLGKHYPHTQRARTGKCILCGKSFKAVKDFKHRKQKYCSNVCRLIRGHKKCLYCGKDFSPMGGPVQKYCSTICSYADHMGPKSSRWKDGKSLERNRGRQSGALSRWKREVKKRDNFTCVRCGGLENLHAHHVKYYADFPGLSVEVNNGETLCEICHSNIHGQWLGAKSRRHLWRKP